MHDVRRPLPFRDGSAEAIYSAHLLEHLHFEDAQRLLADCYRVLTGGGILRVVVPDLAQIIERYRVDHDATRLNVDLAMHDKRQPALLRRLYHAATQYHDHKWMYDAPLLLECFRRAGFRQPVERVLYDSDIPDIRVVEQREGLCVEARRERQCTNFTMIAP